jgi:CRISPR system Cascade subunit CasE
MHRTLLRGFPNADAGGPGRVLFRIEPVTEGERPTVLVQSEKPADWSALPANFEDDSRVTRAVFVTETIEDRDSVLVLPGACYRFRLLANPTVKRDGKRHGLYREESQRDWLNRKGQSGGFAVEGRSLLTIPDGTLRSSICGGRTRSWFGVRFDGRLKVTNPSRFVETLQSGVGSGKGFGFGLLSVMRE